MTYSQFKAQWLGHKIDYDKVDGFQCVDLILQFLSQCAGVSGGVSGNAVDYAKKPSPAFVKAVNEVTDGSKQAGDILVFVSAATPDGHIALRDTSLDKMLEQNGVGTGTGLGKDAIGVYRVIPYNHLIMTYRLKVFSAKPSLPHGTALVTKQCYVRSAPNTSAPLAGSRILEPGNTFVFIGKVQGQSIAGNSIWYESQQGHFVWSGNAKDI